MPGRPPIILLLGSQKYELTFCYLPFIVFYLYIYQYYVDTISDLEVGTVQDAHWGHAYTRKVLGTTLIVSRTRE